MKLKCDDFPNFYKKYEWTPEREDNVQYFIGREHYFHNFWNNLAGLVGSGLGRTNKAFIGQRKLGKTAFLKRCYNVTFWEQDEVIPFYYCFPQKPDLSLRKKAKEIVFYFLRQAAGFITKNQSIFDIESEKILLVELKKYKVERIDHLEIYWEETQQKIENEKPEFVMEAVWDFIPCLSAVFRKECLLILDEYQKTYEDLVEDGEPIHSHDSIAKTVNNMKILTMISGSQISMLAYKVMISEIRNRMPDQTFAPLFKKEVYKLVQLYANGKGYEGIEEDVYELVGGNPFYVKILFTTTEKYFQHYQMTKTWATKEELLKSYNFEVLSTNGEIFSFWRTHLREKQKYLNGDKKEHKGLTVRLLKFIAEKKFKTTIQEIQKEFPQLKDVREKIVQLRETDLIQDPFVSHEVYNFSDMVLPVILTKMYQQEILGNTSEEALKQEMERLAVLREENLREEFAKIRKDVSSIKKNQQKAKKVRNQIQKDVEKIQDFFAKVKTEKKSDQGKVNLAKGKKAQASTYRTLKKKIVAGIGPFAGYRLKSDIRNFIVDFTSGGGCEVDAYCELQALNGAKPQKFAVVGEIKKWQSPVSSNHVESFIDSISIVKRDKKQKDTLCFFIAKSGFSKPAKDLLEQHKIIYGNSRQVFKKMSSL